MVQNIPAETIAGQYNIFRYLKQTGKPLKNKNNKNFLLL